MWANYGLGEPGGQAGDFKSRMAINEVVRVRVCLERPPRAHQCLDAYRRAGAELGECRLRTPDDPGVKLDS